MQAISQGTPIADAKSFAAHFAVSRETMAKLEIYAALIQKWQPRINLIAPSTLGQLWHRHLADSAQLATLLPAIKAGAGLLDLGSGAGFPALVLACLQPEMPVTMVESDQRKAIFLREAARQMGLARAQVLNKRIERCQPADIGHGVAVVTARALASLDQLCHWAWPFLQADSQLLLLKGAQAKTELTAARKSWDIELDIIPSLTEELASILVIKQLSPRVESNHGRQLAQRDHQ